MLISKKTRIGGLINGNNGTPNDKDKIMLSDKNKDGEQNQECCSLSSLI